MLFLYKLKKNQNFSKNVYKICINNVKNYDINFKCPVYLSTMLEGPILFIFPKIYMDQFPIRS